jgi:hypothetical protein
MNNNDTIKSILTNLVNFYFYKKFRMTSVTQNN